MNFLIGMYGMVYFGVKPTNRPTTVLCILIINKLCGSWSIKPTFQPNQPPQFSDFACNRNRPETYYVGNRQPTDTNPKHNHTNHNKL